MAKRKKAQETDARPGWTELGVNVSAVVNDGILTLAVRLDERHGASASGKTTRVASTLGNKPVPGCGELRVGCNVYERKAAE